MPFTIVPAMASRRSLGVVLIVALLTWSVSQRAIACPGMQSRAAVVAPAGSPPAPKPEPSPSRHNCCPLESKHFVQPQSPSLFDCGLHAKPDLSCCSMTNDLALRLAFPEVSRTEFREFLVVSISLNLRKMAAKSANSSLPELPPALILASQNSVLRL